MVCSVRSEIKRIVGILTWFMRIVFHYIKYITVDETKTVIYFNLGQYSIQDNAEIIDNLKHSMSYYIK